MNLLALTQHTGVRIAEVGFLVGAIGGVLLALAAVMPSARKSGGFVAGAALVAGFVLLIVAAHWGHFS